MGEYRIILPKTTQGGFASDPEQGISNSGSPMLDKPLTIKNGLSIGIAAMYGKRVLVTAAKAAIGQTGNGEMEMAIESVSKMAKYGALTYINPTVGILAVSSDMFVSAINYAVESHAINLENERTIEARGTRRNNGIGGYYG